MDRRSFLQWSGAALVLRESVADAQQTPPAAELPRVVRAQQNIASKRGVITPNGTSLPLKRVGNVKVGHLVAQPIDHEFMPGLRARLLGLQRPHARPDDRGHRRRPRALLRHQSLARADHHALARHPRAERHGRRRGAHTSARIEPGETFKYEFTFTRAGTYMYHPHFDEMTQIAHGHGRHDRRAPEASRADRASIATSC